ncbi:sugar phosphate isomerase/epimerase family protein [Paenibacillus taihuensis]|nr:sugar phosphate isomerase/epimerase [Paenibacillus taihuensis]
MEGLGENGREWSLEEKLERISAAGYGGVYDNMPEPEREKEYFRLLDRYSLSFATQAFPGRRGDISELAARAKHAGALYMNAQVMDSFVVGDDALRLLDGLMEEAAVSSLPFFVETHRGRITQDLLRTVEYVNALPSLRLTIDLSHYVLSGEMQEPGAEAEQAFAKLLERTSCIHGRISNSQQIQVPWEKDGVTKLPITNHFVRWWTTGMKHRLQDLQPGEVFPFVTELGPPPYAITVENATGVYTEPLNRWEASLIMKKLAEECWEKATGEEKK